MGKRALGSCGHPFDEHCSARYSFDQGTTWTPPSFLFPKFPLPVPAGLIKRNSSLLLESVGRCARAEAVISILLFGRRALIINDRYLTFSLIAFGHPLSLKLHLVGIALEKDQCFPKGAFSPLPWIPARSR